MDELRVAIGVKVRFKKKLVRRRLKWAGHVERMGDEALAKRSDAHKLDGKRRRGRSIMRWEDCVKRGLVRVGGEGRTTTQDRRSWRQLIENGETEK